MDRYQSVCKECCNLTIYKLKVFADVSLEYNENGRKFSKWVENRGKGGTAPEFMFTSIIVPWAEGCIVLINID